MKHSKKVAILAAAFATMLSLACLGGCVGGTGSNAASQSASAAQEPSGQQADINEVKAGIPVKSETADITIESEECEWSKSYHPSENTVFFWKAGDNETVAVIRGTITNNSDKTLALNSLRFKFVFDGELTFDKVELDTLDNGEFALSSSLDPKATKSFCVGAKVPDSVYESYKSMALEFSLDGKEYCAKYGKAAVEESPESKLLALGESTSTANLDVAFNEIEWMDEVLPPAPIPGMDYVGVGENQEGMTWLVFKGMLTNNANDSLDPSRELSSRMIKSGEKQYKDVKVITLKDDSHFSHDGIVPGETRRVYAYTAVPDQVKNSGEPLSFSFAVDGVDIAYSAEGN